jgi:hypothetical protein
MKIIVSREIAALGHRKYGVWNAARAGMAGILEFFELAGQA